MRTIYNDIFGQNPYIDRLMGAQPRKTQVQWVNGQAGVDAYQMAPSSSVLLLDQTQPLVWLKKTDETGYPTTTPFLIQPYKPEPEPDLKTLNERIAKLEAMLNDKPDITAAQPGTDTNAGSK